MLFVCTLLVHSRPVSDLDQIGAFLSVNQKSGAVPPYVCPSVVRSRHPTNTKRKCRGNGLLWILAGTSTLINNLDGSIITSIISLWVLKLRKSYVFRLGYFAIYQACKKLLMKHEILSAPITPQLLFFGECHLVCIVRLYVISPRSLLFTTPCVNPIDAYRG